MEFVELSAAAKAAQEEHANNLKQLEIKKRQRTVVVPTKEEEVIKELRRFEQPIALFGERLIDKRVRLQFCIAQKEVEDEINGVTKQSGTSTSSSTFTNNKWEKKQTKAFHTEASDGLIVARNVISVNSWQRAKSRLASTAVENNNENNNNKQANLLLLPQQQQQQQLSLEVSQVGGKRPLTCCSISNDLECIAMGSFDEKIQLWNMQSCQVSARLVGHQERVVDVIYSPRMTTSGGTNLLASGSVDTTVRLWKTEPTTTATQVKMESVLPPKVDGEEEEKKNQVNVKEYSSAAILKGHAQRICRLEFDFSGTYLVSTSYDKTWRLWNVETEACLLIQEGHSREVYGAAFHPDGALVATTDLGGIIRIWDLRNGKTVLPITSHALSVLCCDFHPNGYHFASGGMDSIVRVHDLRKKSPLQNLLAHNKTITRMKYCGDELITASHDKNVRVFSASPSYVLKQSLIGHEGPIFGLSVGKSSASGKVSILSCGYDKTWKIFS